MSSRMINFFYQKIAQINPDDLVEEKIYVERDGELIQLGEIYDERYRNVFQSLKKVNQSNARFFIGYQKTFNTLCLELSGSDIKVLMHFLSRMDYKNCVYNFKYQELVDAIGMSYETVTKAIKELMEKGYVKRGGKRSNYVYHLSPEIGWKGNTFSMYNKIKMFKDED